MTLRAGLYVDGFNLYHALDELNQPHLKWLNLWDLGRRILIDPSEELYFVRYCTALKKGDADKSARHREYITALQFNGVDVHKGHFITDEVDCHKCGHVWDKPQEKETDVNIAVHLIDDAYQDQFDVAYLLTSDSDQGAVARMLKFRFPDKKLVSVAPPGMEISKAISPAHTPHKLKLPVEFVEDCLLPGVQMAGVPEKVVFRRPDEYKPPDGWTSPRQRRALIKT
jgi:uncharacterized LabA/DUF88 family protein